MKNYVWAALAVASIVAGAIVFWPRPFWSHSELNELRSLWIGSLPPPPPDPSNRVADDPRAIALGEALFFDARLSANGQVSCATCHRPDNAFQDGLPLGRGIGVSKRRTPTLIGVAYSTWLFWDGRKDSLWAQALAPLENPSEHGGDRLAYARVTAEDYRAEYETLFGRLPEFDPAVSWESLSPETRDAVTLVFVNIGKAIAAYERTLLPQPTRFDAYVGAVLNGDQAGGGNMSQDEIAGLKLFLGKANCVDCHNGPLFTDHEFHNTGVPPAVGQPPDIGWYAGLPLMLNDEFGCKGKWSDAGPAGGCVDRRYLIVGLETQQGAFKTPTLLGVSQRAPYMHAGQFATLEQVLQHYRTAPSAAVGKSELKPLELTDEEVEELIAFLGAVSEGSGGRAIEQSRGANLFAERLLLQSLVRARFSARACDGNRAPVRACGARERLALVVVGRAGKMPESRKNPKLEKSFSKPQNPHHPLHALVRPVGSKPIRKYRGMSGKGQDVL